MTHRLVLHVARGFSAQPTLAAILGPDVAVIEAPLAQALYDHDDPDLVWVSEACAADVRVVRDRFPSASILATAGRQAHPGEIVLLLGHGADLVLRDEGVVLAAAGLQSLLRRLPRRESILR